MGILVGLTATGIASLQKYDADTYKRITENLSSIIAAEYASADNAFVDINFAALFFKNANDAKLVYQKIRTKCLAKAIALSGVMHVGEFDIKVKMSNGKINIKHGKYTRDLRKGLRLFKALGIRLPKPIPPQLQKDVTSSVFLPIAGQHNLVDYYDLKYKTDCKQCAAVFAEYISSTKGSDNHHSRYYVPLILNLVGSLENQEFECTNTGDGFLSIFKEHTKKPSTYRRALGYGVILARVIERIVSIEEKDETLRETLEDLLSSSHARKLLNPYLYDERVLGHNALSALVKFNLI